MEKAVDVIVTAPAPEADTLNRVAGPEVRRASRQYPSQRLATCSHSTQATVACYDGRNVGDRHRVTSNVFRCTRRSTAIEPDSIFHRDIAALDAAVRDLACTIAIRFAMDPDRVSVFGRSDCRFSRNAGETSFCNRDTVVDLLDAGWHHSVCHL